MTDIENRKKALALLNEVRAERGLPARYGLPLYSNPFSEALCRAIEQHETFRHEVSDAVEALLAWPSIKSQGIIVDRLARFIIAKPDPLVEAIREMALTDANQADADRLCEALAKRGGKIVWEDER